MLESPGSLTAWPLGRERFDNLVLLLWQVGASAHANHPLSLRHQEAMRSERGIAVDHSTMHRWALKLLPVLGKVFSRHERSGEKNWRMDETYTQIRGE